MSENQQKGLVIKAQSGFFTVETPQGPIVCRLRGILLQEQLETDPCAVGDHVTLTVLDDGSGIIESVAERQRALSRNRPPGGRDNEGTDREHVILANPDQAAFVFSCVQPAPNPRMLDRLLVVAEKAHIPVLIVANKVDLVSRKEPRQIFKVYEDIGYPVIYTSATSGKNVKQLHKQLTGKISALAGPSGVGKSSLLNAMQPGLGQRVAQVSEATEKGRHTTVSSELFPLDEGGYVADTPGIRSVALYDVEPDELDGYFVEIARYVPDCRFNDCSHTNEPGCAVVAAVKAGSIEWDRYDSFLRLREQIEDLYI